MVEKRSSFLRNQRVCAGSVFPSVSSSRVSLKRGKPNRFCRRGAKSPWMTVCGWEWSSSQLFTVSEEDEKERERKGEEQWVKMESPRLHTYTSKSALFSHIPFLSHIPSLSQPHQSPEEQMPLFLQKATPPCSLTPTTLSTQLFLSAFHFPPPPKSPYLTTTRSILIDS